MNRKVAGAVIMLVPLVAAAFVGHPLIYGFLICFPIGWQLFRS